MRSTTERKNRANPVMMVRAGDRGHAIFDAITRNSLTTVKEIIRDLETSNVTDVMGTSALHYAVMMNRKTILEWLILEQADVNTTTHDQGRSPLYSACLNGNTILASILVGAGAKVKRDKYNWFPDLRFLDVPSKNG